jgi:hypothetical protein
MAEGPACVCESEQKTTRVGRRPVTANDASLSAHSPSRWGGFTTAFDNINVALTIEDAPKRVAIEFTTRLAAGLACAFASHPSACSGEGGLANTGRHVSADLSKH